MRRLAILVVPFALSCGSTADDRLDLSATMPSDLAIPDLGSAADLASTDAASVIGCAGTKLAGTCAEKYFEPFMTCFRPSGHCATVEHNSGSDSCWLNGAAVDALTLSTPASHTYAMRDMGCLGWLSFYGQTIVQYCPYDQPCTVQRTDGGQFVPTSGATYDRQSGIFTCPTGEQVDIGPNLGGCSVLNTLLAPVCDNQIAYSDCPYHLVP